jgi:hypothetical protein
MWFKKIRTLSQSRPRRDAFGKVGSIFRTTHPLANRTPTRKAFLSSDPITDMVYGKRRLAFEENLSCLLVNFSFVAGALLTGVNNPVIFLANLAVMDTLQCCFSDGEYHLHK